MTIICLLAFVNLSGQSRQLILQIDTIDAVEGFKPHQIDVSITNQGFAGLDDSALVVRSSFSNYPNFIASFLIKTDSSNLRIPLDDKHGYIELYGLKHLDSDTLKIPRLVVYSNCNPDTSFIVTVHKRKSSKSEEYEYRKGKKEIKIDNPKCVKRPPDTLEIVINRKSYKADIKCSDSPITRIMTGNRVRPKRYYAKDDYAGPIRRMRIESETRLYLNNATINLN